VTRSYVSRVVRLNFLAPGIMDAILAGKQPAYLSAKALLAMPSVAANWAEQARDMGFSKG
jgi:hypothetical protein